MIELSGYVYLCSAGETFDQVALNMYGNEKYAAELMNANPELVHVSVFAGGEELSLPALEISENETPYAPATAPWKG